MKIPSYSCLLIGLTISLSMAHAEIDSFEPSFPNFHNSAAERKANNQFYYLGEAKFPNGVSVPFYGVTAENPADGDGERLLKDFQKCNARNCDFTFKLNVAHAKQLKLLALPSIGLILVPRDWQDVQSNAGANGTGYALIMSPDHKQAIELSDSSFCVGCGIRPATLYFPNLLKQSLEYEFGGYQDTHKLLNVVHPNKNVAYFSYQMPSLNYKTHGVAKYRDTKNDFNFRDIHVTIAPPQQALTTTILNFYLDTH